MLRPLQEARTTPYYLEAYGWTTDAGIPGCNALVDDQYTDLWWSWDTQNPNVLRYDRFSGSQWNQVGECDVGQQKCWFE